MGNYFIVVNMKAFSVIGMAASVSATVLTPGDECPQSVVKKDFDLMKYLGTWYEFRPSFGQPFRTEKMDCIRADYSMRDDKLVKVLNSNQERDDVEYKFQPRTYLEGKAKLRGDENVGQLAVSFFGDRWGNYDVIDTDYKSFALVYSCNSRNGTAKDESAWVLTRDAIDAEDKRPYEGPFKKTFETNVPTFNYTYVFNDTYSVQGTTNGCDGPKKQEEDIFLY